MYIASPLMLPSACMHQFNKTVAPSSFVSLSSLPSPPLLPSPFPPLPFPLPSLISPSRSLPFSPPPSSFSSPPSPFPPLPLRLHSNSDIHLLPLTLGRLRNCWELILHGLKIFNVPQHLMPGVTRGGSTKHLLAYLRAQLRHCVPYSRMKLMLVGLQVRFKRPR